MKMCAPLGCRLHINRPFVERALVANAAPGVKMGGVRARISTWVSAQCKLRVSAGTTGTGTPRIQSPNGTRDVNAATE